MRLLILGGTAEASTLARRIAGRAELRPILSFAGLTRRPDPPPIPFRTGGFGGVEGLRTYLRANLIDAVIDATHPFAATMSANAAAACAGLTLPIARLTRPPWRPSAGDRWTEVPTMQAAARALGEHPRRVMLTVGGLSLAAFAAAPHHHYIVRSIEYPEAIAALPSHELILARGPFDEAGETALLREREARILVTKNSGGTATQAKLAAARAMNVEVVMVARPPAPAGETLHSVDAALDWIAAHLPPP